MAASTMPPPASRGALAGAARLTDYWATVYKRTWKGGVVTSFVTPFFYILAMGVLLGDYVTADPAQLDGAPSYLAFIAPGMVAVQAMTIVFSETTYPVMGMLKWQRIYYSMIASPLSVGEIVLAQLAFVCVRVLFSCGVFLAVLAPFGVFGSVWGTVLALPAQLLIGLAFATPVFALSAGLEDESAFALVFRLGMIPLTLFSGTFFPIGNLGPVLETVARVMPLWQGVDLTRMLVLGDVQWGWALVHVVYLGTLAAVGWRLTVRRLTERLVK
jgi:lipooligosaccharide transport system permease protein